MKSKWSRPLAATGWNYISLIVLILLALSACTNESDTKPTKASDTLQISQSMSTDATDAASQEKSRRESSDDDRKVRDNDRDDKDKDRYRNRQSDRNSDRDNDNSSRNNERDDDDDDDDHVVNVNPINQPPNGVIASPTGNVSINVGQSVTFSATGSDPNENLPLSFLWQIDGMPNINGASPPTLTFNQAGVFIVRLIVTDSLGLQDPTPDLRTITVTNISASNQAPNGTITSPPNPIVSINVGDTLFFDALGQDPDGNLPLDFIWNFDGAIPNMITQTPGNTQFNIAGVYNIQMTARDSLGLVDPSPDTLTLTVQGENGGDTTPPPINTSHAGRFSVYEGSKTCINCHENEVHEAHNAVHYQWQGPAPDVTNISHGGKLGGMNDFCGYPDINFIGLLTNLDGQQVDGGCATCHVGMGAKPSSTASQQQLENIDCLVCHSDTYKRKVDQQTDGSFRFVPAPEKMTVPLIQAITDIHKMPSSGSCVNCHSYAGGGCNNKRGDLEEAHRNVLDVNFDVHMAPVSIGGAGLTCVNCHTTLDHKVAGRGVDLRPTDLDVPVQCTNCHNSRPHSNTDINNHTAKVDCTVCHIPRFAKVTSTDMIRDYSKPAQIDEAKRLYEPNISRQVNVIPEYRFYNGTSYIYEFGTAATSAANGFIPMALPMGNRSDSSAKIHAFKRHAAVLPIDPVTQRILPIKQGILFQTGNVDQAIQQGTSEVGWSLPSGYQFEKAERFMGIFHEVSTKEQALNCNDCHGGNRMDFNALGYTPKSTRNGRPLCSSCHSSESGSFTSIHSRHVDRENISCSECHNF